MTSMRVLTMAAIRDARGLTASQKVLLYTVESRGQAFSTASTLRADCGLSKRKFYEARKDLTERGLLEAEVRRPRGTTVYKVRHDAVKALSAAETNCEAPGPTSLTAEAPSGSGPQCPQPGDASVTTSETSLSSTLGKQRETSKGHPQGDPIRGPLTETIIFDGEEIEIPSFV